MGYLVNKYGQDDRLYPKDPEKRAIVDRMLYFDMGTLYKCMVDYFVSLKHLISLNLFKCVLFLPERWSRFKIPD